MLNHHSLICGVYRIASYSHFPPRRARLVEWFQSLQKDAPMDLWLQAASLYPSGWKPIWMYGYIFGYIMVILWLYYGYIMVISYVNIQMNIKKYRNMVPWIYYL